MWKRTSKWNWVSERRWKTDATDLGFERYFWMVDVKKTKKECDSDEDIHKLKSNTLLEWMRILLNAGVHVRMR